MLEVSGDCLYVQHVQKYTHTYLYTCIHGADSTAAAAEVALRAAQEASRKASERSHVDALQAQILEKQKNQKAAYGQSDAHLSVCTS